MKNNIFILSGPSGAGEDSVIKGLKEIFDSEKIITTTTREPRSGEIDGKDYFFVSHDRFREMIRADEFFEWAEEENGQLYGGTKKEIDRVKKSGKLCFWKIDYKGVIAAKKLLPDAISIFIYIPIDTIRQRLKKRANHSELFINSRIAYAKGWFDNENIFDYKIENEENKLKETIEKIANIIKKHYFSQ